MVNDNVIPFPVMKEVKTIAQLCAIISSDPSDALDKDSNMLPPDKWSDSFKAGLSSYKVEPTTLPDGTETWTHSFEFHNKFEAWVILGQRLGMLMSS